MATRRNIPATYLREATVIYRPLRNTPRHTFSSTPLRSSEQVYALLGPLLCTRITESLVVLALTTRSTVIGMHEVARGSVNSVPCRPVDILRYPLIVGAAAIILAHNHPSGDCSPSADDLEMTRINVRLARELGLQVLDHIIIAADGYFSMLDAGTVAFRAEPSTASAFSRR